MGAAGALAPLARRAWERQGVTGWTLWGLLLPASAAFAAVVAARNWLFDAGWLASHEVAAGVVSVGNLSVGGTGKTPVALWLAEALRDRGRHVALVARGYGKRRRGVTVVGEGGRLLASPEEGGDEAAMLARRFAGPVVTAERRVAAVQAARERFGVDTIVLDDGFQHRALARDIDLVLLEKGGGCLLPAGPRREPRRALVRAGAVLDLGGASRCVPGGIPVFPVRMRPAALVIAEGGVWREEPLRELAGRRALLVSGLARPSSFYAMARGCGADISGILEYPDHHRYGPRDWRAITAAGREAGLVLTTEKDLVKLERFPFARGRLAALRVVVEVEGAEALLALVERALAEGRS